MAVLAQAAGAASMPFFASLWARRVTSIRQRRRCSVSRVSCLGLLAASAIVALGQPLIDFSSPAAASPGRLQPLRRLLRHLLPLHVLLVRPGHLLARLLRRRPPSSPWPLKPSSLVSHSPLAAFYHWHGAVDLAIASNIGVALQTITIAVLLHERRMVSLGRLDYPSSPAASFPPLPAVLLSGSSSPGSPASPFVARQYPCARRPRHPHPRFDPLARHHRPILLRTGSALPKVARRRLHSAKIFPRSPEDLPRRPALEAAVGEANSIDGRTQNAAESSEISCRAGSLSGVRRHVNKTDRGRRWPELPMPLLVCRPAEQH